jgi:hypothetical protein
MLEFGRGTKPQNNVPGKNVGLTTHGVAFPTSKRISTETAAAVIVVKLCRFNVGNKAILLRQTQSIGP